MDATLNKLNQILIETSKLSNLLDEDLDIRFQKFIDTIGESFNCEYCNVGYFQDGYLNDAGIWSYFGKTDQLIKTHEKYNNRKMENTLIGATINVSQEQGYYHWNFNIDGEFTNEHLKDSFNNVDSSVLNEYRNNILQSKKFFNFLVLGIYNDNKELLGYIALVNKVENDEVKPYLTFSDEEIKTLQKITGNIAILVENVKYHLSKHKDIAAINAFHEVHDSFDDFIEKVLDYLNEEFNSIIAAYLVLAKNGLDDNKAKIVRRSVKYSNNQIENKYKNKIESNFEGNLNNSLSGQIFTDTLKLNDKDNQEKIKFIDFKKDDVKIMWDFVEETSKVVAIPIIKSKPFVVNIEGKPQNKIWGVICLFTLKEKINEADEERLNKFAKHTQVLIEKFIYKKRYHQVETLDREIVRLEQEVVSNISPNDGYLQYLETIKTISNVEACSLFFLSEDKKNLYLKSTTAKKAYDRIGSITALDIDNLIQNKTPLYDLNKESITGEAFQKGVPIIVYDIEQVTAHLSFVEETKTRHKSIVTIPLRGTNNEYFGVLRCVNKNPNSITPFFVDGDVDMIKHITNITLSFLLSEEFHEKKQVAMTHFAHESRIPIQAINDDKAILSFLLRRFLVNIPDTISIRIDTLTKNISLLMNNIKKSEAVFLENIKEKKVGYKKTDLNSMIKQMLMLFNRKILPNKIKAPEIFVNEEQIYQVFYNLLLNADRYSNKGTTIYIYYDYFTDTNNQKWHQFRIDNYGIGINETEKDKIFEHFYRSEAAKKVYQTGTGIGLTVCKEIMESHNGKIAVTKLHYPTEFSIYFPDYLTKKIPFNNETRNTSIIY